MNHNGNFIKRTLCATLACVVFLGCFVPSIRAEVIGTEDVFDLILEVKRNRKTLSNAVIGLEKDGKYFLPVLDVARVVGIGAEPDLAAETLSGFFLDESNSYGLDIKGRTYSLNGEAQSFPEGEAFILEYDYGIKEFYASPDLLNKIWPLKLELDNLLLRLNINTSEKLPYELQKARELKRIKRMNRLAVKSGQELSPEGLVKLKNKPKRFSLPAVDINMSAQYNNATSAHSEALGVSGRNDLGYGEANYNFNIKNESDGEKGLDDIRFVYTKQAYDDDDLPLDLELFQLGDVSVKPGRLVDGSIRGRGTVFTNAEKKKTVDFDSLVVEGITEPGWEVELYRNNTLLGFQIASDTGEYRFEDVQLNYNKTIIKTVLYGPQGQVEEREDVYNISRDMLRPGEVTYEVGLLDADRDLFVVGEARTDQPRGFAKNINLRYGINSNLTAFGSITDMPTEVGAQRYGTLGLKFSLFNTLGAVEAYRGLEGGTALDFSAARNFLGANLNLRAALMSDFESEAIGYGDQADTMRLNASVNRSFPFSSGALGLGAAYDYDREQDGVSRSSINTSQSLSFKKLRLTHTTRSRLTNHMHQGTEGRMGINYRLNPEWRLRSLSNYDIYPERKLRNFLTELRYQNKDGLTGAFDVDHSFSGEYTRYGAQVGYDFGKYKSSFDLDWDGESGVRAVVRTRFSLAPYGGNSSYIMNSGNLSSRGAVNGRVFLDKDYDGVFSQGDEPIEGAKIKVGRSAGKASKKNGVAGYMGAPDTKYQTVSLDMASLDDPYMTPSNEDFQTIIRPANAQDFDFPVIQTGIIEGVVNGANGAVASINVQLLDAARNVLRQTRTAFDGYYSFEFIRPGDYIVQVDPEITQVSIPPRSVSVTSEDLFQFGIDLSTLEQAAEAACVESADEGRVTQNCHNAGSTSLAGIEKPALGPTGEDTSGIRAVLNSGGTSGARVSQVRIGEYTDKIRIVLDLSAPTAIRVWEQSDRKQVSIDIQDVAWDAMQNWVSKNPHLLKDFNVSPLGQNGATITINALHKIEVAEKMMLTPNGKNFYRFYIDFKQCANGCK
jgi:hypothetical protein